jgi:hypothetical protein
MLWNENEDALLRKTEHSQLKWVIVDGELHDVTDFADLPPAKRPPALCPICSRPVTMKLGTKRIHHCAHQPGDECAASHPETALHLNMKFHIYRQLQQVAQVLIEQKCNHCQATRNYAWVERWERVEVEYGLDSIRPDAALVSGNVVIAAIEVFVSHAVDDEKAQRLHELGIPWIEVFGNENFFAGEHAWRGDQPIAFYRQKPESQPWTCESCKESLRKHTEEDEYRRRNYTHLICFRIVDFFYPDRKRYRDIYQIMEQVRDGERVEVWLARGDHQVVSRIIPIL